DPIKVRADIGSLKIVGTILGRIDHGAHEIGRDGEADADGAARAAVDRRVDADHLAPHIDQSTARIARIDSSVGLDEITEIPNAAERTSDSRNDAAGGGLADAKRIADGKHQVSHLKRLRITERRDWKF